MHVVSRGGNFVFRAALDGSGRLTLGLPVVRYQGPIASVLSAGDQGSLKVFLASIDGRTDPFRSAADDFRDVIAGGP